MNSFIKKEVIKDIGERRYFHSRRVVEIGLKLAEIYNEDKEKVKLAAILHDCGKLENKTKLLKKAKDFDIILDIYMKNNIELIHGPLGARIAGKKYKINDQEILNAIKYHTTGRENMTLLDKIIYIADYIEPRKDFQGIEAIRQLAYKDINKSIIMAMDKTIKHLIDNKNLIHINTIRGRNDLIINDIKEEVHKC